jgi:K+-transporting ATPase ATPase B chain
MLSHDGIGHLSRAIFNPLIIVALIPLALGDRALSPAACRALLQGDLLIYGVDETVAPFFGIKFIDVSLTYVWVV